MSRHAAGPRWRLHLDRLRQRVRSSMMEMLGATAILVLAAGAIVYAVQDSDTDLAGAATSAVPSASAEPGTSSSLEDDATPTDDATGTLDPAAQAEQVEQVEDEQAEVKKNVKKQKAKRQKREQKLREAVEGAALEESPEPAVFRVATFNLLGASHTSKGGNKPKYRSGESRTVGAIEALNANGISIAALQEFEITQKSAMRRNTSAWAFYSSGSEKARDAVAWRTDVFELVESGAGTIPYFRGNPVPLPWVLLRHRETGREIYAISLHNPVSNAKRGNNQKWRNVATAKEAALVNQFAATGRPVLLMGDFNEKAEAFCQVTRQAPVVAANGGTASPCSPPAKAGIDWIFGTYHTLDFSSYARIDAVRARGISDHPLIAATVTHAEDVPTDE